MKTRWPAPATEKQRAATVELLQRLNAAYPKTVISITLFGSAARGDFTSASDIDVLIVTDHLDPDLEWEMWGVGARVSLEYDVVLDLHVYSRAHWEELRRKRRPLWAAVERDGVALTLEPVST